MEKGIASPLHNPSHLSPAKGLQSPFPYSKATYLIPEGETFPLSEEIAAMSLPSFLSRFCEGTLQRST